MCFTIEAKQATVTHWMINQVTNISKKKCADLKHTDDTNVIVKQRSNKSLRQDYKLIWGKNAPRVSSSRKVTVWKRFIVTYDELHRNVALLYSLNSTRSLNDKISLFHECYFHNIGQHSLLHAMEFVRAYLVRLFHTCSSEWLVLSYFLLLFILSGFDCILLLHELNAGF